MSKVKQILTDLLILTKRYIFHIRYIYFKNFSFQFFSFALARCKFKKNFTFASTICKFNINCINYRE